MTDNAIVVEGIKKHYDEVVALDGVDLEVEAGTVFGLLGPNGAGKTTMVRVLATVLDPDEGRAEVLGYDVMKQADAVRRRIGLAGQYAAVDANLTGRENLHMVGVLSQMQGSEIGPRAGELLDAFSLSDAADRPVRTYSGGMRRRLDIAASLVHRPPILFLDEPTTGLDITSRNALWDMIRDLVDQGTTVLLTTQYLEEADQLASRIAVVDEGKVIANDTPVALKADLGSTVVEMEMSDTQVAERAVQIVTGRFEGRAESEGSLVRIASDQGAHALVEVLRALDVEHLEPVTLVVREPSMDDVFLTLTGHRAESPTDEEPSSTLVSILARCRMSSTAVPATADIARDRTIPFSLVRDTLAITKRNLIAYRRVPQLLVFSTIQPVIFVLMFTYVFGGAIDTGPIPYIDYLMPGIFVQVVVFGSIATAIGLASDLKSGLLERFRSLPMGRSAVLTGRTFADLTRNVFVVTLMMIVGFLVGWRIHTNVFGLIAGGLLVLLFGYSMSWIFATVGLAMGDPETAQAAAFPVLAPLVFASSAFVPVDSMPSWLQPFAEHQPVSVTASAVRALTLGGPTASWVLQSIAWTVVILAVFGPWAVRIYRKSV